MTWDITTPTGSDNISNGDNIIREFKTDIQAALKANDATLGDEGVFPVSTSSPKYRYRGLKGTTAQRPAAGNGGLYYDTTRQVLQRDNGSAWEDIGIGFAATTALVFYQASAPTGWTKQTSENDKYLRVVSGTGGGSGGTGAASTGHTHSVPAHYHRWYDATTGFNTQRLDMSLASAGSFGINSSANARIGPTGVDGDAAMTSGSTIPAYIDCIVCTKD